MYVCKENLTMEKTYTSNTVGISKLRNTETAEQNTKTKHRDTNTPRAGDTETAKHRNIENTETKHRKY